MPDISDAEVQTRQWVAIQRAGTGIGRTQQALVKSMFVAIRRLYRESRGTPTQIANDIEKLILSMGKNAQKVLGKDLKELAQLVADNAHTQVAAIGVKSKSPNITDNTIMKWLTAYPMASSITTIADLSNATFLSASKQAKGAVILQQTADAPDAAVREAFRNSEAQLTRRVMTDAVSGSNQVANLAKNDEYKKATREADRVMWMSTLDALTSPFCQLADGKLFPIDSGPRPPAHPNCRSTIILVGKGETAKEVQDGLSPRPAVEAKSEEQLAKQGLRTKGGNYRGPSITDRSPLKGVQTRATTYEGWLRAQPKYYQEAILGKSATVELRSGKSLSRVLKNRNSAINFDSLKEALN